MRCTYFECKVLRYLNSCGLYKKQSVELISFHFSSRNAGMQDFSEKLTKNEFIYLLVKMLTTIP